MSVALGGDRRTIIPLHKRSQLKLRHRRCNGCWCGRDNTARAACDACTLSCTDRSRGHFLWSLAIGWRVAVLQCNSSLPCPQPRVLLTNRSQGAPKAHHLAPRPRLHGASVMHSCCLSESINDLPQLAFLRRLIHHFSRCAHRAHALTLV